MASSTTHAIAPTTFGWRSAPTKTASAATATPTASAMTLAAATACIVLVAMDLRPGKNAT